MAHTCAKGTRNDANACLARIAGESSQTAPLIDEGPAIEEMKSRLGDWEGDTIEGGGKKGYVGTFVDRKAQFLVAFPLKRKSAAKLVPGVHHAFAAILAIRKRTATVDNGKEFARNEALASAMGAKVFFAHPYHSG